ncbi:MAG TPA: STAS domain-containing protein [Chroococcales cyanobacterium]
MEKWILREGNPATLILRGSLKGKRVSVLREVVGRHSGPLRIDLSGIEAIDGKGFAVLAALGMSPGVTLSKAPRCVRLPLEKTRLFEAIEIEP